MNTLKHSLFNAATVKQARDHVMRSRFVAAVAVVGIFLLAPFKLKAQRLLALS